MANDIAELIRERARTAHQERSDARWKPHQDAFASFMAEEELRRAPQDVLSILAEYPALAPADWVVRFEPNEVTFVPGVADVLGTYFAEFAALHFTPKPFLVQQTSDVPLFGVACDQAGRRACLVERRFDGLTRVRPIGADEMIREPLLLAAEAFEASLWGDDPGQRPVTGSAFNRENTATRV